MIISSSTRIVSAGRVGLTIQKHTSLHRVPYRPRKTCINNFFLTKTYLMNIEQLTSCFIFETNLNHCIGSRRVDIRMT